MLSGNRCGLHHHQVALIDEEGALIFSHYGSNGGNPLKSTIEALKDMYRQILSGTRIVHSAVTGYGKPC